MKLIIYLFILPWSSDKGAGKASVSLIANIKETDALKYTGIS